MLGEKQPKEFVFPIPAPGTDSEVRVRFVINHPVSPKSVGVNGDPRKLGFGFVDMTLLKDLP